MNRVAVVVAAVAAAVLLAPGADGSVRPAVPAAAGSDPSAVALLLRAVSASESVSYRGVQLVSGWSAGGPVSRRLEIEHVAGSGLLVRVPSTNAAGTSASGFDPAPADPDPVEPARLLDLLTRSYQLGRAADSTVAGRTAHVVEARRPDGGVAARLWLDTENSLVLRREMYDAQGRTVRASVFLMLVPEASPHRHLPPVVRAALGPELADPELTRYRATGAPCPATLGGLTLVDARELPGPSGPIMHLTYSDGLAAVSVFEQAGHLDPATPGLRPAVVGGHRVAAGAGLPDQIVWSAGGQVLTVIGDAPPQTLAAVVAALPHGPQRTGLVPRLERGSRRVLSWLNPFA